MFRFWASGLAICGLLLGVAPVEWTPGTPASTTGEVLAPVEPRPLVLPKAIADRVTGPTLLYYFSPTCPHCRETAPGIAGLSKELAGRATVLGVASASSDAAEIPAFVEQFGLGFDVVQDLDRSLARAVGLRSTPVVVWVEPAGEGHQLREVFSPFYRGAEEIVKLRMSLDDPFSIFESGVYMGRHVCSACHGLESVSWSLTHHSIAYATLYLRNRATDLECVGCHVTGLDQGGFEVGDHRSPLSGVGCESCHGPGGPHDGVRLDAAKSCVGCHDKEHSLAFTVEAGLPHIDHYLASTLEESEIRDRRNQLARGEAARPLAEFSAGPNVGSGACKSCHKSQWKNWRKSPHGQAMKSLSEQDEERVFCVACHATPREAGPEPQLLAGFHVTESVGCESCHGPGGEHVSAPDADNILGLGTRCPECVIEEVCTSCHDNEWDPRWNLQQRLESVRGFH